MDEQENFIKRVFWATIVVVSLISLILSSTNWVTISFNFPGSPEKSEELGSDVPQEVGKVIDLTKKPKTSTKIRPPTPEVDSKIRQRKLVDLGSTNRLANKSIPTHSNTNWVTISYGGLVGKSIITHSGKAVGTIIQELPKYTDSYKGQVQRYLEPFSTLCHDVLLSTIGPDTPPLINILAYYPIGSEQPAWVDLFREGHFQLYFNANLIRVFLKGTNPKSSFEKYQSVIRHSIQDVISSTPTAINNLEVYVFNNDYAKTKIRLNTIPHIYKISDLNLSPKRKPIDLSSIEHFLEQGVILEAVEVDTNNDLYFYGKKASTQTLAKHPVSLSDIAVIYRSIFHYGNNAPYISLDQHEDNRYAKVNFGGHLENTHTGNVVLEADKLFKLLSTGIDPNTHKLVKSKITKYVPNFLTEEERLFLGNGDMGHTQIRYWFYPNSIGTETDGSIGSILNHQFLADAERLKTKVNVSNATKKTIAHLNQNFSQYERAENTFKELSTVGRIMALVNWLEEMHMGDKVELDDLLSVKIPPFTTPKRTKKMLVASILALPENYDLTSLNVRDYSKVYYISHLLDQYNSSTSDNKFLEIARDFISQIDVSEIAPPQYSEARSEMDNYGHLIELNESEIKSRVNEIDRKRNTLNRYDSSEVDRFNNLISENNRLLDIQESYIDIYNSKVRELKNMNISPQSISAIGGGISLRPSEFKPISRNSNSPKLQELIKIKSEVKTAGKVAISGNWIRSAPGIGGTRTNKLPVNSWKSSKSVNGKIVHNFHSNSADVASVTLSPNLKEWQSNISVNGSQDMVKYSQKASLLEVKHIGFANSYKGTVSTNGKNFVFQK